jgi:NADPH-dependent 2,4-dienoyl-CoA reductase/sulfur reductase-like enzyme
MIEAAGNNLKFNLKLHYDLIVIGGGPAGMAAALEANKQGLNDILIVERQPELGGILTQCIHNGFGSVLFKKDMPGPMYAEEFVQQVLNSDIQFVTDTTVMDITPDKNVYITGKQTGYAKMTADAIVLCMGCRERTRAQIKLPGSRPAGVFTAGTVQRLVNVEGFMPGREFVILGSGDIGMIMARRLTLEGAKVKAVLELLPYLTGLRRNYVQCLQDFNIPLYLQTTIKKIIGNKRLEAVETMKVDDKMQPIAGSDELIKCDTLMLSVGLIPENELSSRLGVELDPLTGGPLVDEKMATNVPGVFAAGNVVTIYDLVDFVSQAGFVAGRSAASYVKNSRAVETKKFYNLKIGRNVRSLVPQKIHFGGDGENVSINFRVANPVEKPVSIEIVDSGNNVIKSFVKRYARPAEMLTVDIKPSDMNGLSGSETRSVYLNVSEKNQVSKG